MTRPSRTFSRLFKMSEADQLKADLASYRTQSELADLYAILDRYPVEQTEQIRDILVSNTLRAA